MYKADFKPSIKRWLSVFIIFLLSACSAASAPALEPAPLTLSIAHINDTHSAFDPLPGQFTVDGTLVFNEWGGHPRLLERIEQHRQSAANHDLPFLVLHGGDAWQGSAYFKVNEGRMNADILSRMGIDAMALGNHEFDLSNAHLNEFAQQINFPLLAANIDTSRDPDLAQQHNLKAYTLFAFNGIQKEQLAPTEVATALQAGKQVVAIFGITLDDMPNISPNTGDIKFFDMIESAQATVDELEAMGIHHILAVTHIGNALDVTLAQQVNGIDAIIGGHSHTLLGDFSQLGLGKSARAYAEKVTNPNGLTYTCVVQAGDYARAAGLLEVSFDSHGQVQDCGGENTLLSGDVFYQTHERSEVVSQNQNNVIQRFIDRHNGIAYVAENTALRSHIDTQYKDNMLQAYGEVIAHLQAPMAHVRQPGEQNSDKHGSRLATLFAIAQYSWALSAQVQAVTGLKPDFSLLGAGGIRTSLDEGELREGHITLEALPFASPLSIVPLRGLVIRQLLTETITATLPDGAHAGRFPYGGQIRYEFQETKAGEQGEITRLEVNNADLDKPRWRPIEDNVLYNVVMNSYIATGNDGWDAVFEAQQDVSHRVDLAYVNGELRVFPVQRIRRDSNNRLIVEYSDGILDCSAAEVSCNTDAKAVVEFIEQRSDGGPLPAINYPTVTLQRVAE